MIPKLNTTHLQADVQELTVGQCIALAGMPDDQPEHLTTSFLEACITNPSKPVREWRAEERMFAVAHYLAATLDDGPNFRVGADARFLDYIIRPEEENLVKSDKYRPLNTIDLERIERAMNDTFRGRTAWLIGSLASQSNPNTDDEFTAEVARIMALPASEFEAAFIDYLAYQSQDVTLFRLTYTDEGFAAMGDRDGDALPVARFPAAAAIPELFRKLL